MVRSAGRCVSTGHQAVVNGQQSSKLEIVVLIMCTILVVYLLIVMAVIVVLIKNKAQREYYMSTLVSLKVAFFLSCIKNKGWKTK